MFVDVAEFTFVSLPFNRSGNTICHHNISSIRSMGRPKKIIERTREDMSQFAINRRKFQELESHWGTVRIGHLKSLDGEVKVEIERIYKEELDPRWLPNRYCSGCYFKAVQDLIQHFFL